MGVEVLRESWQVRQGWCPLWNDVTQLGPRLLRASLGCEQLPEPRGTGEELHRVPSGAAAELRV